jgi:hypothetical protein
MGTKDSRPKKVEMALQSIEDAMGEFKKHGVVKTVRCHECNALVDVAEIADQVWKVSCPCGVCSTNLLGL